LLFNFVMHCIISTVVVAFEINYLILTSNYSKTVPDRAIFTMVDE